MLTGALSLGRVWDIKSFLGKRVPRIVEPFIFWGLALSILMVILSYYCPLVTFVNSFDFATVFNYITHAFLAESSGFTPFWFFWMILGVYLIMPIFNKWILHSDLKEVEYFLVFCLITTIFDCTLKTGFPVELSYFSGPIGMVVLGYYLRYTKRKIFDNLYVPIVAIIIGCICSLYVAYISSSNSTIILIDKYSIFILLEAAGIFLLFRNLSNANIQINLFKNIKEIFRRLTSSLAKYSYGIYLIHSPFLTLLLMLLNRGTDLSFRLIALISFVTILFLCWGLLAILDRIPYINEVIGAK